ncbi:hypothetical protein PQX77_001807 [Marasmius sp. AFHP31]|nr:hypothetical protein PQX77_001807 [Marasmius sp. AFHP31]
MFENTLAGGALSSSELADIEHEITKQSAFIFLDSGATGLPSNGLFVKKISGEHETLATERGLCTSNSRRKTRNGGVPSEGSDVDGRGIVEL